MNIVQEELNSMRSLAGRVKNTISQAFRARGTEAGARLEEALTLAAQLETRLDRAGAERPQSMPVSRQDVPLELLDTPANRRYAAALEKAWEAGLEVDRERFGPQIGTDGCAQVIEMVLADVNEEIYGPAGRNESSVR